MDAPSPETFTALILLSGSLPFLIRWLWDRLWRKADSAMAVTEKHRDEEIADLKRLVAELAKEVRDGFAELRGLINKQDIRIAGVEMKTEFLSQRVDKLEAEVASIRDAKG